MGGVGASDKRVIEAGVGRDIACGIKMSVIDWKPALIAGMRARLANVIESETKFGVGAAFERPRTHPVLEEDCTVSPVTSRLRDKAWKELGTSGSGNHFV